jgi:hypothetical protein
MSLVCYARVSSTGQSLEVQEDLLKAAGGEEIFKEKRTGTTTEGRDELEAALRFARRGDVFTVLAPSPRRWGSGGHLSTDWRTVPDPAYSTRTPRKESSRLKASASATSDAPKMGACNSTANKGARPIQGWQLCGEARAKDRGLGSRLPLTGSRSLRSSRHATKPV